MYSSTYPSDNEMIHFLPSYSIYVTSRKHQIFSPYYLLFPIYISKLQTFFEKKKKKNDFFSKIVAKKPGTA